MIKKLLLGAALLVPGLAYAGNPSANLSVQIVPAMPGGGLSFDVSEQVVAGSGSANSSVGLNTATISGSNAFTYNGQQYLCYYDPSDPPRPLFLVRNLNNGAVRFYDPKLPAISSDDPHRVCAIAVDVNGYIHLSYGQHANPLTYYRSNSPGNPGSFTAHSMLGGTPETEVTYPFFIVNGSTGALYFTFRYGVAGNGDQYFYSYNPMNFSWSAAPGTGRAGLVIHDMPNPSSPYLNGTPKWDSAGRLWFNWQEFDGSAAHDQYLMGWTGTSFVTPAGARQAIPATSSNISPVLSISTDAGLVDQNEFAIGADGVFFIPYQRNDANGVAQIWVAENSSGSFVEHQLTSLTSNINKVCGAGATGCSSNAEAFTSSSGNTYVVYTDVFVSPSQGIVAFQSSDHFQSFTASPLFSEYMPNFEIRADPSRLQRGIVSFLLMDENDPQYGFDYSFQNAGQMMMADWMLQ